MRRVIRDCHFQEEWLDDKLFPEFHNWLQQHSEFEAKCVICKKKNQRHDFTILNIKSMGVSALTKHADTLSHINSMKAISSQKRIKNIFNTSSKPENETINSDTNNNHSSNNTNSDKTKNSASVTDEILVGKNNNNIANQKIDSTFNDSIQVKNCNCKCTCSTNFKNKPKETLNSFYVSESVTKAEIFYAFCQVRKQASLRCFSELAHCLPLMFSDSSIAKKFSMQKDKLSYSINYGLGPYCQKKVLEDIYSSDFVAFSIDESLNKYAQKGQMDIVVRFWKGDIIHTKYLTSVFMVDATAEGILKAFTAALNDLNIDLRKIIQIYLDGPNVNLKFLRDIKLFLLNTLGNNVPQIIDIGTCSLHTVNNGFKT